MFLFVMFCVLASLLFDKGFDTGDFGACFREGVDGSVVLRIIGVGAGCNC
jgi:hypothetical protein